MTTVGIARIGFPAVSCVAQQPAVAYPAAAITEGGAMLVATVDGILSAGGSPGETLNAEK